MPEWEPVPAVCLHPSSVSAFRVFNPNAWSGASKLIVQSCATEFAGLGYSADRLVAGCRFPIENCRAHFETLAEMWAKAPWDHEAVIYFGQVPEIHILVEAFFSGLKSLLDLTVQLLSTEGVVSAAIDGFHRAKGVYGGTVLNALVNNVKKGRESAAAIVRELLVAEKAKWIDDAIGARDSLVHPTRGAHQLMFRLFLEVVDGELTSAGAEPPKVGAVPMQDFVTARVANAREFSTKFLAELRNAA
jgi:hypothetical protein